MVKPTVSSPTKKKLGANKLVMGFAALAATAVIGTTGFAAAAQNNKPDQQQCAKAGFRNYGRCVSAFEHERNGHMPNGGNSGSGYGGNTANVALNLNVSGSNNVINIVLNLFR